MEHALPLAAAEDTYARLWEAPSTDWTEQTGRPGAFAMRYSMYTGSGVQREQLGAMLRQRLQIQPNESIIFNISR